MSEQIKKTIPLELTQVKNQARKIDELSERRTDELVIAFTGPIGAGCTTTAKIIGKYLTDQFGYEQVNYYIISDLIVENASLVDKDWRLPTNKSERVNALQDMGNKLREKFLDDYLAAKAIEKISLHRLGNKGFVESTAGSQIPEPKRWAHILDSLKNPSELKLLREVYGDMLWVIGVFAPEDVRGERLKADGWEEKDVVKLTSRDDYEEVHYGQGVRNTFYQADFFIRNDGQNEDRLNTTIKRHLGVIFGEPVHTPTKDEAAMYSAYAAASRSACMSRQVGAAIVSKSGELIGVGWNDVPKYAGGLYSEDDQNDDHRCFKWGRKICHNDDRKDKLFEAIFNKLKSDDLLADKVNIQSLKDSLRSTDVNQLIEYSRAIHAEMSAILDVVRNAKAGILGSTLFCTTFPCHICARHLIGAGVGRVVYIEPYPKSLARELHKDATSIKEQEKSKKLLLQQYEGVSPRNIFRLFKQQDMKRKESGKIIVYNYNKAKPVGSVSLDDFSTHEKRVLEKLKTLEECQ